MIAIINTADKAIKPNIPHNKPETDFTTTKKTMLTKNMVGSSFNNRNLKEVYE